MLASFSTKGEDADDHQSDQNKCRRIEERQAEEGYDLRGIGAAAEETCRVLEIAVFRSRSSALKVAGRHSQSFLLRT
jgi:hypothetical protein